MAAMNQHHEAPIVGILLAAGRGRRFDPSGVQNKLMQTLPNGEIVAVAAATAMRAAMPHVVAVVRPGATALTAQLQQRGCDVTVCADADQGMGASLVHALKHMENQVPPARAWIIALADMPYVQASTITALVAAIDAGADIAVPVYQGQRGNPVAFGRRHLSQLLALGGDEGARQVLKSWPLVEVEVDDAGIRRDIDTMSDLPITR